MRTRQMRARVKIDVEEARSRSLSSPGSDSLSSRVATPRVGSFSRQWFLQLLMEYFEFEDRVHPMPRFNIGPPGTLQRIWERSTRLEH